MIDPMTGMLIFNTVTSFLNNKEKSKANAEATRAKMGLEALRAQYAPFYDNKSLSAATQYVQPQQSGLSNFLNTAAQGFQAYNDYKTSKVAAKNAAEDRDLQNRLLKAQIGAINKGNNPYFK